MSLGALIFGVALIGSAIKCGLENTDMKSKPHSYMDDGTPVYIDRKCRTYINGEQVVPTYDYNEHRTVFTGKNSKRVYYDPEVAQRKRLDSRSEDSKRMFKELGYLAYMRYDHDRQKDITCEIATDKYIAELEGREDGTYYKYYLSPNSKYVGQRTPGDPGVRITREEYDKLNILGGTHFYYDLQRGRDYSWHSR